MDEGAIVLHVTVARYGYVFLRLPTVAMEADCRRDSGVYDDCEADLVRAAKI
ncbi:proline--tRNA ligase [Sesbania bispinosa]|nr:proline--tRNA ligase [Sesbania bispinosa]